MSETVEVKFTYKPVISIEKVNLVGDFNDWDRQATPMFDDNGDGTYEATLKVEPGEYQYKFLINEDNWQKPPDANYYVDDGFGNKNGVVKVESFEHFVPPAKRGNGQITVEALEHDNAEKTFINPLDKDKASIRFRTKRHDVERVILHYNDGHTKEVKLAPFVVDNHFEFYRGIINVDSSKFQYVFKIQDGDRVIWYDKDGFQEEKKDNPLKESKLFEYDLSTVDIFKTPDWVRDAIFYQIFPDRFYNGNPDNDPDKIGIYKDNNNLYDAIIPDWEEGVPPSSPVITRDVDFYDDNNAIHPEGGHYVFYGGDLQGIEKKLPYLKKLGVNAIYLNPIFKATSNHKYNTEGYELVDDTLAIKGDLEASEEYLIELMQKLHKNDIKVIFDAVFNHTGYEHWAFQDIVEKGQDSKYVDWYHIKSFPIIPLHEQNKENPPNYECWWNFGHLPQLNTENSEVREYLFEVTKKWMDPKGNGDLSAGIDGWRLDVPNEVKDMYPDFWKEWRKFVKEINPEIYIVGEIWDDASGYLQGDEFDSVMNYRFRDAVVRFIGLNEITADEFANELGKLRLQYPEQVNKVMFNLIGSHDTTRYLTVINENKERLKLTAFFQMTYLGVPVIYYGDEIGMKGKDGCDCRRTMIWKDRGYTKPDQDILEHYQKLIKIKKEEVALRRGNVKHIDIKDNELYIFKRSYKGEELLVIINVSENILGLDLNVNQEDGEYLELYQGGKVKVENGVLSIRLPGIAGAIVKLK
ncbi:alpha amylase N-terminal ig-like domain-containing protein [Selenihalanaerobacter shriftii]|uniref:Glycosidase n=1 Tax=Selenihalanaerobacter shriftii TaxID=142842 RepID=A0A1T4K3F7_9FIRM|nr:alpha amylase N-terminal ig-like domain-containing protein [Selenihalanaerobacter shriftii]SJZ36956.1 Glycosidase [Selenihalanaerobacter shriftii]